MRRIEQRRSFLHLYSVQFHTRKGFAVQFLFKLKSFEFSMSNSALFN